MVGRVGAHWVETVSLDENVWGSGLRVNPTGHFLLY